jgi:hypothetical protein
MSLPGLQVAYYLQSAWKTYGTDAAAFAKQFRGISGAWLEVMRTQLAASNNGTGPAFRRSFPAPGAEAVKLPFVVIEWRDDALQEEFLGDGGGLVDGSRAAEILLEASLSIHAVCPTEDGADVLYEWARAMLMLALPVMAGQGFHNVSFVGADPTTPAPQYIGEGGGVWMRSQHWKIGDLACAVEAALAPEVLWALQLETVRTSPTPPPFQTAPTDPNDPLPAQQTLDPDGTPGGVVPVED